MKAKSLILLIIIIVLIFAGFYGYSYFKNHQSFVLKTTQSFQIKEVKISDNTKPLKIDIVYPSITGLDDFNKKIRDTVDKELLEFRKNSLDNDMAVKETDPVNYEKYPREYDLIINYTKGQVDQNIASIVLNVEGYTGGAHPYHYSVSFNYDVKNKKDLGLADLLNEQKDYLQKISDYCIKDLTDQMTKSGAIDMSNTEWLKQGAGPDEKNYSVFLINPDSITFYFGDYQVAAYAAGDFKVNYPR